MACNLLGFFTDGNVSPVGLCDGPFPNRFYGDNLNVYDPITNPNFLYVDSGCITQIPDDLYYSDGINIYYYKGGIQSISGCTTPTTTTTTTCPPNCAGCGEEYSAYSETQCYTLLTESPTPPSVTLPLVPVTFTSYSTSGTFVYDAGYSVSGFTNISGGDFSILPNVTLWKNIFGNTIDGPLNRCAVWTSAGPSSQPINTWVGFSQCIDIEETKTYYIGIGADNDFRLVIDGTTIVNTRLSNTYWYLSGGNRPFNRWNVYPITLNSGNHIVELYGWNLGSYGSVGCEIYDNTLSELQSATLYSDLNVLFTSSGKSEVTIVQNSSGEYLSSGYTCSSGYVYNACNDTCVKYEFCDICPEPIICPFESYCVSTGNEYFDDTYYSGGTYNEQLYWTGDTSGLFIFLSETENCWCLSDSLGGECFLFGPTPCNDDCPDLCDSFFNPGPCPTPTPTPTQYCQPISFEAAFDCELPITPTPTTTSTSTPTPTPTPTSTEICGGKGISVTVNILTPTPTATGGKMVPTPTASPQYNCNFDGSVVFNTFDDYIRCNGSKRFKDCTTGMLYHTTDVVLDPFGGTPAEDYVYQSFVDGISTCISYEGFVSNIAGVNTINLTSILGKLIDGACSQCVIINTPTPTPTLTSTPTPTPTTPKSACYNYLIENNYIETQTFSYTSCVTGLPVDGVLGGYGSTTICSSTLPTTTSSFITITNTGLCNPTPTPTSTSVTPTPTPTQGIYVPTCSLIYNTNSPYYYSYDLSTNISTELGIISSSPDITHTQNKLWVYVGFTIKEYDITLSPWSLTFNRDIISPHVLGSGLGSISNTKLLSSNLNASPTTVVELDITTNNATSTILFTLSSDRVVSGDLLLTTTGKVLVTSVSYNPTFKTFLSQYDYSTGTLEVDVEITNFTPYPYGIFQSSGLLYIINVDGNIYNIPLNAPYTPVYVQTIQTGGGGYSIYGASQVPNCLTVNLNV
jgi:hypothetical protein